MAVAIMQSRIGASTAEQLVDAAKPAATSSPPARGGRCSAPPPLPPPRPPRGTEPTAAVVPALLSPPGSALELHRVYEEHFDFVWRSARRLGVHERALDDAVQDVFLVVHRRLAEFEGRSTLKSWLFGITRRVAHDHRRRADRKDRGDALPEGGLVDPRAPSPAHELERERAMRTLHAILDALDDDKREVFVLAELEQMTVPEIAAAIDANLNTVYSRLRAARQAFDAAVARHRARERSTP